MRVPARAACEVVGDAAISLPRQETSSTLHWTKLRPDY
jgi:hypothetical protein